MTQKEFFTIIANGKGTFSFKDENDNTAFADAVVTDDVVIEFAKTQLEKLSVKNDSRNAKAREKKAEENKPFVEGIYNILADGEFHTCASVAQALNTNTSKISALVKNMKDVEVSDIKVDKKKARAYKLVK